MLYYLGRFIAWVYLRILYRVKVHGIENVPGRKPFIICSNHINWMDPLTIGTSIPASYRVHYMAKNELFNNFVIAFLLRKIGAFPVKREYADYTAIKRAYRLLKEGQVLGLFPEGSRSTSGRLQKAYNGAALIAVRSGVPIVPVAVVGPYRLFKPVHLYIGAPFVMRPLVYEKKDEKKEQLEEMSRVIMESIGRLQPNQDVKQ